MNEMHKRELDRMLAAGAAADVAYQLGRQHQRDSDAKLCKGSRMYTRFDSKEKYLAPYIYDGERHEGVLFSEVILKNTGDK